MRLTLRNLLHNPAFAATAILSLALGIGANSAMFTLTNQILLRVLPVKDPARLVAFHWKGQFIGGSTRGYEDSFSYPMYADLRGASGAFTGIAAQFQETVDVSDKRPAGRASAELVSGTYFDVLGVAAAIGRTLTPDDDRLKGGEPYVVLSYDYWQRQFGSDLSALNRTIDVNGHPMTVVGVAQRGFQGLSQMSPADLFVPLVMKNAVTPTWDDMNRRDSIWLHLFARLRPGMDARAAQNSLAGVYRAALDHDLATNGRSASFATRYVQNQLQLVDAAQGFAGMREFFAKPLYVLLAMVGTLLLIACANVANLLIARAQGRQKEISIRLALGATRGALMRLIMSESLLIAAVGTAAFPVDCNCAGEHAAVPEYRCGDSYGAGLARAGLHRWYQPADRAPGGSRARAAGYPARPGARAEERNAVRFVELWPDALPQRVDRRAGSAVVPAAGRGRIVCAQPV